MARPSKDTGTPPAPDRIKAAFWKQLEAYPLKEITVSMVAGKAHCNRGTFYYHFDSLDALLDQIIEDELMGQDGLARDLFRIASGCSSAIAQKDAMRRITRTGLLMQRAGYDYIVPKVRNLFLGLWEMVLCDGDDCLQRETRLTLEYSLSGTLGLIDYLCREGLIGADGFLPATMHLMGENSRYITQRVCETQGIKQEELTARLAMFVHLVEMKR